MRLGSAGWSDLEYWLNNGVVFGAFTMTKAIEDDQHQGFVRGGHKFWLIKEWKTGILKARGALVTAGRDLADLCGCVYWPPF